MKEKTEVKKDIEWLKGRFRGRKLFKPQNDREIGYNVAIDEFSEYVDQLDEPEVLSQGWMKDNQLMKIDPEGVVYYVPVENLQSLLVPKQEITEEQALRKIVEKYPLTPNDIPWILDRYVANVLVEQPKKTVIPSYVADLMEDYNDASIQSFLSDAFRNYREGRADRADTWIIKNSADFVDAYRYGYTVEKEQKYFVVDGKHALLCKWESLDGWKVISTIEPTEDDLPMEVLDFGLTEQEIKDYDERYFAFAVPVEELEE